MFKFNQLFFIAIAFAILALAEMSYADDNKVSNESEAGVIVSSGNSSSESYSLKQNNGYKWDLNTVKFAGQYLRTVSNSIESARNWTLGLRYERELSAKFSAFAGESVESNKYAGIKQKYNSDLGGKYFWMKSEELTWSSELGYRYTSQNLESGTSTYSNGGRAYNEVSKAWSKSLGLKWWMEYIHNFDVAKDYQFNTEFSLSSVLTDVFSIKTAFLYKYDNQPAVTGGVEAQKTDRLLTTALVAKF